MPCKDFWLSECKLLDSLLAVFLEEGFVLFVFESVELVEVFAFEAVLVRKASAFEDCIFD